MKSGVGFSQGNGAGAGVVVLNARDSKPESLSWLSSAMPSGNSRFCPRTSYLRFSWVSPQMLPHSFSMPLVFSPSNCKVSQKRYSFLRYSTFLCDSSQRTNSDGILPFSKSSSTPYYCNLHSSYVGSTGVLGVVNDVYDVCPLGTYYNLSHHIGNSCHPVWLPSLGCEPRWVQKQDLFSPLSLISVWY